MGTTVNGFRDPAETSACSYLHHPIEDLEPLADDHELTPEQEQTRAADALNLIFHWLTAGYRWRDNNCRLLAIKTATLIFVVQPGLLGGNKAAPTAAELASWLGLSRQSFNKHTRAFRSWSRFIAPHLRGLAARQHMAVAARRAWRKRQTSVRSSPHR